MFEQLAAIEKLISGQDVFVTLPTGFGKRTSTRVIRSKRQEGAAPVLCWPSLTR